MAKEKSKGKAKKEARKAELEAEQALKTTVATAAATNLLSLVPPFAAYKKNGLDLKIEAPSEVTDEQRQWCVGLLKTNMAKVYEEGGFPWSDTEQTSLLKEADARLLLVRDADGCLLGFSHFRYLIEGDVPVLYVYELQLEERVTGKGLGRHVMAMFQLAAVKTGMHSVMATVMRQSDRAMRFFLGQMKFVGACPSQKRRTPRPSEPLRQPLPRATHTAASHRCRPITDCAVCVCFVVRALLRGLSAFAPTVDETSPSRCDVEDDSQYEILSKCLVPTAKPTVPHSPSAKTAAAQDHVAAAGSPVSVAGLNIKA